MAWKSVLKISRQRDGPKVLWMWAASPCGLVRQPIRLK